MKILAAGGGWSARLSYQFGLQGKLVTQTHQISVTAWSSRAQPMRLVYASDFHAGATTDPRLLRDALAAITSARADVLLLGGDFVNLRPHYIDALAPQLAAIPARYGRYAV